MANFWPRLYRQNFSLSCLDGSFHEGTPSCNMQKPKDDRAVGATRLFWSDHECASVEKIICPVEQREISFHHDVIRRSVTDVVLSFLAVPRHVFQYLTVWKVYKLAFVAFRRYWNGPQYMSCYPKSEWLLLIMAHYFGGILTCDSRRSIGVFHVWRWLPSSQADWHQI